MISPLSMSPPETPPARRARGATEGNGLAHSDAEEVTKLLLPQGPMSAAASGDLGVGVQQFLRHELCPLQDLAVRHTLRRQAQKSHRG